MKSKEQNKKTKPIEKPKGLGLHVSIKDPGMNSVIAQYINEAYETSK